MSKLTRVFHKIFGISATFSSEMGKYGSLKNGSPQYAADLEDIQEYSNWEGGLYDCVVGNNSPAMQDINSAFHHSSRQLGYIFQQGVPEWDNETTYYTGSVCLYNDFIYKSVIDDNLGFEPTTDQTVWAKYKVNSWEDINTDQTLENNAAYVVTKSSGDSVGLILPKYAAIGDQIIICTNGTAGWILSSNSDATSQKVVNNESESSTSLNNTIELVKSSYEYSTCILRCIVPDSVWQATIFEGCSFAGNWFGDGSDGDVTISSSTELVVQNKNGSYDGDMIVKNYTNLTINTDCTLSPDQPCRGMLIYVSGDCEINGSLCMTKYGALRNPSDVSATGIRIIRKKSGESDTLDASDFAGCGSAAIAAEANQSQIVSDGKIYAVAKVGGSGATAVSASSDSLTNANNGSSASGIQSGGGGGGGAAHSGSGTATAGVGTAGTCFGGGSGGGGRYLDYATSSGGDATAYCGAGGAGYTNVGGYNAGGGAGNPGGSGHNSGENGEDGVGGLLILIVRGNLTIGSNGKIEASGADGGSAGTYDASPGGGGSGGGVVICLYAGTLTNNGSVEANGGVKGTSRNGTCDGGNGGAGSVTVEQIKQ